MHPFESSLQQAIDSDALLPRGKQGPVLVALSGGADSVALLAGLAALGYPCAAAHCNYHLRGPESDRDMRHAQAVCAALGVDAYVRHFDVQQRRLDTGESVEMACRELRYQWFAQLQDRLGACAIAVAHHREDNVETVLLNLLRGTGLAGLGGMRPRNGSIVRPLLGFSRRQIEDYLADRGIAFVNDSSNAGLDYARNRLRNRLVPLLEELFPGASQGILASASHLADNHALYAHAVSEAAALYMPDGRTLNIAALRSHPQARVLLFELLKPYGFNMAQAADILKAGPGAVFSGRDTRLEVDRATALLVSGSQAPQQQAWSVSLSRDVLQPLHIRVSMLPAEQFRPERNASVACFDASILDGDPAFELRRWRAGDRMRPFGLKGTRLVSDMMSDAKYSAEQKRRAWLLTRNGEVLWIPGLRAAAAFPVTAASRSFLRLEA